MGHFRFFEDDPDQAGPSPTGLRAYTERRRRGILAHIQTDGSDAGWLIKVARIRPHWGRGPRARSEFCNCDHAPSGTRGPCRAHTCASGLLFHTVRTVITGK